MSDALKLLTDWTPFEYTPDQITESRDKNGGGDVDCGNGDCRVRGKTSEEERHS